MKHTGYLVLVLLSVIFIWSFTTRQNKDKWDVLFNGKNLSGWDTYLGPATDSAGKKLNNAPLGLNNDPFKIFSVVKDNGQHVIRISGEEWGGISSVKEYQDYHFQIMFKWGRLTWKQKRNKKKDSGLLYHAVGPHGVASNAWMRSQEFQIEEGNCGDYWGVAGAMEDIPSIKNAKGDYVYNPSGQMITFSQDSEAGRHCIKTSDAENPAGKWNTLDLYCYGDTSVHIMNGKIMMVLYHSRQENNGKPMPLRKGKIQIQSEGAEVFYKQIRIQNITALPANLLK